MCLVFISIFVEFFLILLIIIMKSRTIISIVLIWCLWRIVEHYYLPSFVIIFTWLPLSITLLILSIVHLSKLFRNNNRHSKQKIFNATFYIVLFFFTFYRLPFNKLIEKADWYLFYNKRIELINQLKKDEFINESSPTLLKSIQLPYRFPILSVDGNEVFYNKNGKNITVAFFIERGLSISSSVYLIYTNNETEIFDFENRIIRNPRENWKINDNWYRIRRK